MSRLSIADWRLQIGGSTICVVAFVLCILAAPRAAEAQPAIKTPRIGYLSPRSGPSFYDEAFLKGLRELGYIEGQTIAMEYRWANWAPDRLAASAAELVRLKADVIVSTGGAATALAAQGATRVVPIVFVAGDPVGLGLVPSLSRPGGNLTGVNNSTSELNAKRLDLLKEALPSASHVGVIANPGPPVYRTTRKDLEGAARSLSIRLQFAEVRNSGEIDGAVSALARDRVAALLVASDPMLFSERHRIVSLATKARLPGIFEWREFSEAGGLMSYGADLADLYRLAATYVDKILKGAKPGDLPIEQPTKFELVVNLKTAKTLGLTLPQSVLIRADEVIR